jgi:hypothetical protein
MGNLIRFAPFLALFALAACAPGQATTPPRQAPPPTVTRVEVYEAEDWRVEVAHLEAPNEALIRVFGSGGELDGVPLPYRYESTESGRRWVTEHRGRQRSVLYGMRRPGGDAPLQIHLPGARHGRTAKEVEDVPVGLGEDIAAAYAEHLASGHVEALQRFDRDYEVSSEQESYERSLTRTREACGGAELEATIDWSTVSDEQLLDLSIASYCDGPLHALRSACGAEGGAAWVAERLRKVTCRLTTDEEPTLTLEGGALTYDAPVNGVNLDQKAREALFQLPDDTHGTLQGVLAVAAAQVCVDDSGARYVVLSPRTEEMAYGTKDGMVQIRKPWGLSVGWFFEPRHFNERHNAAFRGHDLRYYSTVEVEDGACTLKCGERKVPLKLVEGDAKARVFGIDRKPPPFDRAPHALARDRRGVYYYVDRGASEETARDFRLYRGRRGALKRLDMRDIVSDSEGEVFESRAGTLRFLVGKGEATWVERKRPTELKVLPVDENLGVIFNELGVYLGEPLGTPCDDL